MGDDKKDPASLELTISEIFEVEQIKKLTEAEKTALLTEYVLGYAKARKLDSEVSEKVFREHIERYGTAEKALTAFIWGTCGLSEIISGESFTDPAGVTWPPIIGKLISQLRSAWGFRTYLEAKIASAIENGVNRIRSGEEPVHCLNSEIVKALQESTALLGKELQAYKENYEKLAKEVGHLKGRQTSYTTDMEAAKATIAQLEDEKTTAQEAVDNAEQLLDVRNAQITAQSKVYNRARDELDAAGVELSKKATRIQNLEDEVGRLQVEAGRLGTQLTGAQTLAGTQQARAVTAERHAVDNYKRAEKAEKGRKLEKRKKRAGVLGFVAASLLCVYMIQNPIKSQAPSIKDEPVVHDKVDESMAYVDKSVVFSYNGEKFSLPLKEADKVWPALERLSAFDRREFFRKKAGEERIEYRGNQVIVSYGDEVYRMSLRKANKILPAAEDLTPEKRRDYFRKQEKHIKDD